MSMWRSTPGRKQREPRRRLNKPGWISADGAFAVQRCTVENISPGGAQIHAAQASSIPDRFTLSFSQADRRGRRCRVVWRRGGTLGVRFEG